MFKRSRSYKKRSFKKRRASRKSRTVSVAKVSNIIKSTMVRYAELKYLDTSSSHSYILAGSYNLTPLANITQGVGDSNRVGDAVTLSRVKIRCSLEDLSVAYAATGHNIVRIILFQYVPPNTTPPTNVDLLQGGNTTSELTHDIRQQFRVLMDRYIPINAVQQSSRTIVYSCKIPTRHQRMQFQSAGAVVSNQVYLFSQAYYQNPGYTAVLRVSSRVWYRDV